MKTLLRIYACILLSSQLSLAQSNDSLEAMIRTFISTEIKNATHTDGLKIKETLGKIDFTKIGIVPVPQTGDAGPASQHVLYLTVKNIHVNRFVNNLKLPGALARLRGITKVTFTAQDHKVYTGSIVEIATPLHTTDYLEEHFPDLITDTGQEFTGQKSYHTLAQKLLIKAEYVKGVALSSSILKCKPAVTPELNPPHKKLKTECIDCFLVTTYYDRDHNIVSERTDFLYAVHGSR